MGPLVVRKLLISGAVALALFAVLIAAGCDPAPSTPIAPDKALPDTSKMTPEQIQQLRRQANDPSKDRGGSSAPGAPPVGHGETPPDRQLGR